MLAVEYSRRLVVLVFSARRSGCLAANDSTAVPPRISASLARSDYRRSKVFAWVSAAALARSPRATESSVRGCIHEQWKRPPMKAPRDSLPAEWASNIQHMAVSVPAGSVLKRGIEGLPGPTLPQATVMRGLCRAAHFLELVHSVRRLVLPTGPACAGGPVRSTPVTSKN